MVPRKHAEEHYLTTHAPVSCSLCSETTEPEILVVHEGEKCPQRIVTCDYFEFPLPAIDLFDHQEVCGNRTELCHLCNRYVKTPRENSPRSDMVTREAERERAPRRRAPPQDFSTRRLLFTIAIAGIAVVLGSLVFLRKSENSELH